jgi:hypothetical protein
MPTRSFPRSPFLCTFCLRSGLRVARTWQVQRRMNFIVKPCNEKRLPRVQTSPLRLVEPFHKSRFQGVPLHYHYHIIRSLSKGYKIGDTSGNLMICRADLKHCQMLALSIWPVLVPCLKRPYPGSDRRHLSDHPGFE